MMTFKQARERRNLTQDQLAEILCMSQNHISLIEHGKHFPTKLIRQRLESFLSIEIDWIGTYMQDKEIKDKTSQAILKEIKNNLNT